MRDGVVAGEQLAAGAPAHARGTAPSSPARSTRAYGSSESMITNTCLIAGSFVARRSRWITDRLRFRLRFRLWSSRSLLRGLWRRLFVRVAGGSLRFPPFASTGEVECLRARRRGREQQLQMALAGGEAYPRGARRVAENRRSRGRRARAAPISRPREAQPRARDRCAGAGRDRPSREGRSRSWAPDERRVSRPAGAGCGRRSLAAVQAVALAGGERRGAASHGRAAVLKAVYSSVRAGEAGRWRPLVARRASNARLAPRPRVRPRSAAAPSASRRTASRKRARGCAAPRTRGSAGARARPPGAAGARARRAPRRAPAAPPRVARARRGGSGRGSPSHKRARRDPNEAR